MYVDPNMLRINSCHLICLVILLPALAIRAQMTTGFNGAGEVAPVPTANAADRPERPHPGNPINNEMPTTGPKRAVAVLAGSSTVHGTIVFDQAHAGMPVRISGLLTGLEPNTLHGFHIHVYGDMRNSCISAGSHYNPKNETHGAPTDSARHAGDLGNVLADGPGCILGRSIVLHEKADDLGLGSNADSKATGNAGGRLACGVIGMANANSTMSADIVRVAQDTLEENFIRSGLAKFCANAIKNLIPKLTGTTNQFEQCPERGLVEIWKYLGQEIRDRNSYSPSQTLIVDFVDARSLLSKYLSENKELIKKVRLERDNIHALYQKADEQLTETKKIVPPHSTFASEPTNLAMELNPGPAGSDPERRSVAVKCDPYVDYHKLRDWILSRD